MNNFPEWKCDVDVVAVVDVVVNVVAVVVNVVDVVNVVAVVVNVDVVDAGTTLAPTFISSGLVVVEKTV